MDRARLREVTADAIDAAIAHPIITGLTSEQRSVLLALRQTVLADDTTADKTLANVGPYHKEGNK